MDCFVNEDIVPLVVEGFNFKYKPTTAGEENDWLEEYMETEEILKDGVAVRVHKENLSKINICKLRNIVEVPWNKEKLKEISGIDKEWKDMDKDERFKVFRQLKPVIFSGLLAEIKKIDKPDQKKK